MQPAFAVGVFGVNVSELLAPATMESFPFAGAHCTGPLAVLGDAAPIEINPPISSTRNPPPSISGSGEDRSFGTAASALPPPRTPIVTIDAEVTASAFWLAGT